MKTGVIGLGDMGSGIAANLIKNGFEVTGLDLDPKRVAAFEEMGGKGPNVIVCNSGLTEGGYRFGRALPEDCWPAVACDAGK